MPTKSKRNQAGSLAKAMEQVPALAGSPLSSLAPINKTPWFPITLTRTEEIEAFFDLSVLLTQAFDDGSVSREMYPDSRSVIDTVLIWANEFSALWKNEEWIENSYLDEIDNYSWRKIDAKRRTHSYLFLALSPLIPDFK